jgi:type IX secretion system PorP/SprF family membrane protein
MGATSYSQQDPQFTHYMFDKLSVNPGYAGLNQAICATAIYRQQWASFDGAPQTMLLNVHAPIRAIRGGLGFTYFNDKLGFESNNIARLSYSYHQVIGVGTLGIGLSGGIVNKSISANWVTPDGTPWSSDPNISDPSSNATVADFSMGLFYKTNKLYMGLSATHLSESDLSDIHIQTARHYWVMAGYNFNVAPDWDVMPSVMAKSDAASTQIDVNVRVLYKQMVWAGVSYRVADAIAPMVGYQTPIGDAGTLKIGYSYDVTTSQLNSYSNGSHEVMVNYCFNLEKDPPVAKSKNPRFL